MCEAMRMSIEWIFQGVKGHWGQKVYETLRVLSNEVLIIKDCKTKNFENQELPWNIFILDLKGRSFIFVRFKKL